MSGRRKRQGYSKPRRCAGGITRYTALYLVASTGDYLSAGTFDTWEESEAAWQDTLSTMRRGLYSDPRKGRMPFKDFHSHFMSLMTHQKVNTVKNYRTHGTSSILPFFGEMLLYEIGTEDVMRWVTRLRETVSASTIRSYKATLSGMLSTAVKLGYIPFNPALNVDTPKQRPRRIKAVAGQDAQALISKLPGPASRMLVHLDLSTGCRWGEITELRGKDVLANPDVPGASYLDLQRAVADAGPDHPDAVPGTPGPRYYVEETTKNGQDRIIGLSLTISTALDDYISTFGIGPEDLLFPNSRLRAEAEQAWALEDPPQTDIVPDDLGFTEPNAQNRVYRHGTMSGYTAGRCKCQWCRQSYARYRAERRAAGKPDRPTPKPGVVHSVNTSDHLSDDWFREKVYYPAAEAAGIGRRITFRALRHTHATWLAGDPRMDILTLMQRMGHRSLDTTKRYLDDADVIETTSGDIIDEILGGRSRQRRAPRGSIPGTV